MLPRARSTLRLDADVELARVERDPTRRPGRSTHPLRRTGASTASTGHGPIATSTAARSRARATSRRASPGRTRDGTVAATNATPSSKAATTVLQRSAGQRRITAHRSSSTPALRGTRAPSVPYGSTIAAHSPACVAAAASASATDVDPDPTHSVDRHRRAAAQPSTRQQRAEGPGDREPAITRGEERANLPRELGIDHRPPPSPDRSEHTFVSATGREPAGRATPLLDR